MPRPVPDSARACVLVAVNIGLFIARELACVHRETVTVASAIEATTFSVVLA